MRRLGALRALLRIELRALRRHPARALLVVLLVALPVAAMVGGGTLLGITRRTSAELRAAACGAASVRVEVRDDEQRALLAAQLETGARSTRLSFGREEFYAGGRRIVARALRTEVGALEPGGLAFGLLHVTAGRAPRTPAELALSPGLGAALGVTLGERIGTQTLTGWAVDPQDLSVPLVVLTQASTRAEGAQPASETWLADLNAPDSASLVAGLRAAGLSALAAEQISGDDSFETLLVFVGGGFALFVAALVAAAAFAVGLRRRQREIGLVGAMGAEPSHIATAMLGSALFQALVGVVFGAGLGLVVAYGVHPRLDGWNNRLNGPFAVSWPRVLGAALFGLAAASAAVALPAWFAVRAPVRAALAGARPAAAVARAWGRLGLLALALCTIALVVATETSGRLAATLYLCASVACVLGLGASTPLVLAVCARGATPLPLWWRLAVRDAGRALARNGPVVTAVLAALSVSILLATFADAIQSRLALARPPLRADQLRIDGPGARELAMELAPQLGALACAPLEAVHHGGRALRAVAADGTSEWVACAGAPLCDALGLQASASGGLSRLFDVRQLPSDTLGASTSVELTAADGRVLARVEARNVVVRPLASAPLYVLDPSELQALGLERGPPPGATDVPVLLRFQDPVTPELCARARARAVLSLGTSVDSALDHHRPADLFLRFALLASLITGWVIVGIALALSSAESAADARVLHQVGAAPRTLALHAAARATWLALLGALLAVPAGLVPGYGLLSLAHLTVEFRVPWREVFVLVLGLPTLAFVATWIANLCRPPPREARTLRA